MEKNNELKANLEREGELVHAISLLESQPNQEIEFSTSIYTEERNFFGVRKKPQGQYNLKVANVNTGDLDVPSDKLDKLIKIRCGQEEGANIPLDLSDYTTHFMLTLNPRVVEHYKKSLVSTPKDELVTDISFNLVLTQEGKEGERVSDLISVPVQVECPDPSLSVVFHMNKGVYEWDPEGGKVNVGKLVIEYEQAITGLSPLAASFELNVSSENELVNQTFELDFNHLSEDNAILVEGGRLNIEGQKATVLLNDVERYPRGRMVYTLRKIESNKPVHRIEIPVLFDMSKVANPKMDTQAFNLKIEGQYSGMRYNENFVKEMNASAVFTLHKNVQENVLQVVCINNANTETELITNDTYDWGKVSLSPNLPLVNTCIVRLLNTAEIADRAHPNACILVDHFKQEHTFFPSHRIVMKDGKDAASSFNLSHKDLKEGRIRLYPASLEHRHQYEDLHLAIDSGKVIDVLKDEEGNYSAPISLQFEFDYALDLDGDKAIEELDSKHFKGTIIWNLDRLARPEWLSVDFGTSAIVASYARQFDGKTDVLIDLKEKKDVLLQRTYGLNNERLKDNTRESAPFIPSTISFNSISNTGQYNVLRADEDFKTYPVWLSPTTEMMDIMLPCMKNLIGYKTIPNILDKAERDNFKYQEGDDKDVHLFDASGQPVERGLLYVNNVLEEVYKQLFKHFICQDTRDPKHPNKVDTQKLNKLVLSVPNTFTPKHHALVKQIAKNFFPNIRPEYLQVVSESDAVACYYLVNRKKFFENADILTDAEMDRLQKQENVLIFDMGAGTLDLTYFTKRSTGVAAMEIEMKGKMGLNKAGNYLDYLIAEILADLLEKTGKLKKSDIVAFRERLETDKEQRSVNNTPKRDCEGLKNYVRDMVKPLLNQSNVEIPKFEEPYDFVDKSGKHLLMDEIRKHPKYIEFIRECTDDVLKNMTVLFGQSRTRSVGLLGNQAPASMPIDVLVFSGRSTSLTDIRKAVVKAISETNDKLICADLSTNSLYRATDILNDNVHGDNDELSSVALKTVVTFGSLVYADWINCPQYYNFKGKKVFADYGILVDLGMNEYDWYPLITNESEELTPKHRQYGVYDVFKGSKTFSMARVKEIIFVQSYSANPARDWVNGNKDLISVIACFPMPQSVQGQQCISMSIDSNNMVNCNIQQFGNISLEPHDDFQNESLRKSLWPVAF